MEKGPRHQKVPVYIKIVNFLKNGTMTKRVH